VNHHKDCLKLRTEGSLHCQEKEQNYTAGYIIHNN